MVPSRAIFQFGLNKNVVTSLKYIHILTISAVPKTGSFLKFWITPAYWRCHVSLLLFTDFREYHVFSLQNELAQD